MLFYDILNQSQAQAAPTVSSDSGNLVGWFFGCVIAAVVVALVIRPLLVPENAPRRRLLVSDGPLRTRLEGLRESAQAEQKALEDLDFDRELGIIEEGHYDELKLQSSRRLAQLNSQISTLQRNLSGETERTATPGAATAVASKPRTRTGDTDKFHLKAIVKDKLKCSECGTPASPKDRFCRNCQAPLPVICLSCGAEVGPDDRFCAKCGSAVNT